jgi:hypothetical protein
VARPTVGQLSRDDLESERMSTPPIPANSGDSGPRSPMASVIASRELTAAAGLILKLYLEPSTWVARRTDITIVRDVKKVTWTTALQVAVRFQVLADAGLDVGEAERNREIVLPVILKARKLLTGFSIRDHLGEPVRTLTWEQTRPLIEQMLVGTAQRILREKFGSDEQLDPTLERALRSFSGDIDEVNPARAKIDIWATAGPDVGNLEKQADAIFSDLAMRLLVEEYTDGFIVMASTRLRSDGTCDLFIEHDDPIEDDVLRMAVSASPDYQVEIKVPTGARFRDEPLLESIDPEGQPHPIALATGRRNPIPDTGRKVLEPWHEVSDDLLAGWAADQDRGTEWALKLRPSLRNARAGIVQSVRNIAFATSAMFVAGLVARSHGIRPMSAAAPLLLAFPSAYAILLLQRSDVPTRELVAKEPRLALLLIAIITILGAAALSVGFPITSNVSPFGWGWLGLTWAVLAAGSLLLTIVVAILSWKRW